MVEFKVVVNDPEAEPRPTGLKVTVIGKEDIPFNKEEELDKRSKLPVAKVNPELLKKIGAEELGIITIRKRWKEEGKWKKINMTFIAQTDANVPENEVWISKDLMSEKYNESEKFEGEVFRAKAWQITVSGQQATIFIGKKIKDKVPATVVGLPPKYMLEIRGGSDNSGFPMRPDIPGPVKKRALLSGPPGFHPREKGERRRKTVRGNTISEDIVQINTKLVRP